MTEIPLIVTLNNQFTLPSKPAENYLTLITNRLQETLVLVKNTQNNEKIQIFLKASLLTLFNDFFGLFNVFLS